jgi:hypothetical protein
MTFAEALQIVITLADGRNPISGQLLAADHVCRHPRVMLALGAVVQQVRELAANPPPCAPGDVILCEAISHSPQATSCDVSVRPAPANAGKHWTGQEDAELLRAFDAGTDIGQLSRKHGRTRQAIYGRLYRLGKVPAWRPGLDLTREPDQFR